MYALSWLLVQLCLLAQGLAHPVASQRGHGCLSEARFKVVGACPSSLSSRFPSSKSYSIGNSYSWEQVGRRLREPQVGLPSIPKSCFLSLELRTQESTARKSCLYSPVGKRSGLFDHFYNFVIMGCNGLGCLNLTVIAFYCSYPILQRELDEEVRKSPKKGAPILFWATLSPEPWVWESFCDY